MSYYCKTITLREAFETAFPSFNLRSSAKTIDFIGIDSAGSFIAKYSEFENQFLVRLQIKQINNKHSIVLCLLADLLIYHDQTSSLMNYGSQITVTAHVNSIDELERILDTSVIVPYNFD